MALHCRDLKVVVPDVARARSIIQRGLAMFRRVSTNTGLTSNKLRQSERLLERLVRATTGRGDEKVRISLNGINPMLVSSAANTEMVRYIGSDDSQRHH